MHIAEHVRQGHISRQGRAVLRKILVEAAWVAITKDPCLRKIYERISSKCGAKRAIIGIARRLVGRIRSCLLSGKPYEIDIIKKKKENAKNDINIMSRADIIHEKVAA